MELTLNHLLLVYHSVITQVVKTELVIRTVCDITAVCRTSVIGIHCIKNVSTGKSHELIYLSVVFRITFCQVVIYGNYVYAFTFKCVKVYSK